VSEPSKAALERARAALKRRTCRHERPCACDWDDVARAIDAAVAEEREACAKLTEQPDCLGETCNCFADRIRARGGEGE
jgi:hypothetical protein